MAKQNIEKVPPKGSVRFSLSLSSEQKSAKQAILHHPYNVKKIKLWQTNQDRF